MLSQLLRQNRFAAYPGVRCLRTLASEVMNAREYLRSHSDRFFGTNGVTAVDLVGHLTLAPLVLGAKRVLAEDCGEYWVVWADVDWLLLGKFAPDTIEALFKRICAFPEAGDNYHRPEIEIGIFCRDAVTFTEKGIDFVQGELAKFNNLDWKGEYVRALAFRFSP